jgi:hypothetical protein
MPRPVCVCVECLIGKRERDPDNSRRHEVALCGNDEVAHITVDDGQRSGKLCGLQLLQSVVKQAFTCGVDSSQGRTSPQRTY